VDRLASAHDVRFAAQDDDWILVDLEQNFEASPTVAESAEPRSFCTCCPSSRKDDADASCSHTTFLILQYGSVSIARKHLSFIGNSYFSSFPNRDSTAPDTSLHEPLRQITTGRWGVGDDLLQCLFNQIEFRMNLMSVATNMLETANIPLPNQLACHELDLEPFEMAICEDRTSLKAFKYNAAREKMFRTVLPNSDTSQGRGFDRHADTSLQRWPWTTLIKSRAICSLLCASWRKVRHQTGTH
jgi:hypothetical protein